MHPSLVSRQLPWPNFTCLGLNARCEVSHPIISLLSTEREASHVPPLARTSVVVVEEPTVAGRAEPLPRDVLLLGPCREGRDAPRVRGVPGAGRIERVEWVLERRETARRAIPLRLDENGARREVRVHRSSPRSAKWNLPVRSDRESLKTS